MRNPFGLAVRPLGYSAMAKIGVTALILALLAGCIDRGAATDNDKRGVFYGGISAGSARP